MLLLSQLHLQNKGQARHCAATVALQGLTYKCVNDLLTQSVDGQVHEHHFSAALVLWPGALTS